MIRLTDVSKVYRWGAHQVQALEGITLSIAAGEFAAIMGASGSGKSTLLNILGLLDTYDTGRYELAGETIRHLSERQAARYRNRLLGFVFQSFHLLPFKTAVENVALPLSYQGVRPSQQHRRAHEYLALVGLANRAEYYPNQLSGGQQQRVAIARALVTEPKVLLADEPTGNLDSQTSSDILSLLKGGHARGCTIVLVTHEEGLARQADRTIHLCDGHLV
jgi:putative ABC transport system ATP-binding protein